MNWYAEKTDDVLRKTGSSNDGLSEESAEKRLEKYGKNAIEEKPPKSFAKRFFEQLQDFMVIVLLVAAAVSVIVEFASEEHDPNGWVEPVIIVGIVILNALMGVFQESKAEAALSALRQMSSPQSKVIRGGKKTVIDSENIVPGDIVLLEAGDFIPADGRLIEAQALKCDESALTGESLPCDKNADAQLDVSAQLADRVNMCFSGCSVSYGRGTMVVTDTGMQTEMGKIASLLANEETGETPLQKKLSQLGKTLGLLVLGLCAIVFIVGMLTLDKGGNGILGIFMTSVSLAVAAIPEGLPAVVTVVLAIGVQRMVERNAIIRRLPAVETLGSASVICTDKTGTLTQNRMTMMRAWVPGEKVCVLADGKETENIKKLITRASMCCDGTVELEKGREKHIGDPTETAIVAAMMRYGTDKKELDLKYPRLAELPFDSDRKLMTTVHRIDGKIISITKGAPDIVLSRCGGDMDEAMEINGQFGRSALRVLAVGYKVLEKLPKEPSCEELENGLEFMGLLGMMDPARSEVKDAIAECCDAGIRTVMITGDHVVTAGAIAKELGILREGDETISGAELAEMSDEELERNVRKYSVYARVTPSDKIRIVKAWQKSDEVVAMTGDGVNDAPALKAADIGCAMGITGTDVAKGAADVVLTDDNFATIVSAAREGRGIYDNIRKCVYFLLSCNLGEIFTVFIAMMKWNVSALAAMHLLLINLVTDALIALALGVDPIEKDIMKRRPRRANESIFSGGLAWKIGLHGAFIGIASLIAFGIGYGGAAKDLATAQTMTFGVLAFSQLAYAFSTRSEHPLYKVGVFSNIYLWGAAFVSGLVALLSMVTPLRNIFRLVPLDGSQWLAVVLLSLAPFAASEIEKGVLWLIKRYTNLSFESIEALLERYK